MSTILANLAPHRVAVLAFDGVVPSDVAGPCDLLSRVVRADGQPAYRILVCGPAREVDAGYFAMRVPHTLAALYEADTVIVPGSRAADDDAPPEVLHALRNAAERGVRIASVCTGAFVLASAGLLDGRRATTHWLAAPLLAARHPSVQVDASVLYVDEGRILTSAGATAALDLCLHLVRLDHGAAVAAMAARIAVMPLGREGGQAQFIASSVHTQQAGSLQPLLEWMLEHPQRQATLATLARQAKMSARTLNRRFLEQTGLSPLRWWALARVRLAQQLLETTDWTVERIAERVGFASAMVLRRHFSKHAGTTPQRYRTVLGHRQDGPAKR